jgi:hypothetical protein
MPVLGHAGCTWQRRGRQGVGPAVRLRNQSTFEVGSVAHLPCYGVVMLAVKHV